MDPVTLVVAALSAGALSGVGETASTAVQEAYQSLKRLVSARFAGRRAAEVALTEHETDPQNWQAPLVAELVRTAAVDDPRVIEAAQRLMALLDEAGSRGGKYTVDVRGAQGVQVGDQNTQHNTFS
jgi:hypothetical protein